MCGRRQQATSWHAVQRRISMCPRSMQATACPCSLNQTGSCCSCLAGGFRASQTAAAGVRAAGAVAACSGSSPCAARGPGGCMQRMRSCQTCQQARKVCCSWPGGVIPASLPKLHTRVASGRRPNAVSAMPAAATMQAGAHGAARHAHTSGWPANHQEAGMPCVHVRACCCDASWRRQCAE